MVIKRNNDNTKSLNSKVSGEQDSRVRKINAFTAYETYKRANQVITFVSIKALTKYFLLQKIRDIMP